MEFSIEICISAGLIAFLAAFVHGSIGLGFPMVATPLLALFTDIQTAIILTVIPSLLTNLISIRSEGGILPAARRYLLLGASVMAGSAFGTQILIYTGSEIFKALLAAAIIMYLVAERVKLTLSWVAGNRRFSQAAFGVSAGILGGLTNVMAPVLIIYTLESNHSKSDTIRALNFCFLLGKMTQLILFAGNGKFTPGTLAVSASMFFAASLALYGGINLRQKIKAETFRHILKAVLLFLAALLLYQVAKIVF